MYRPFLWGNNAVWSHLTTGRGRDNGSQRRKGRRERNMGLEGGEESQGGRRDEEQITEEQRQQRRQGGRCRERYLITSTCQNN